MRQLVNASFPKLGTPSRTPALLAHEASPMKAALALAPLPRCCTVTPVVTSVTMILVRPVLTLVVRSITSPAAKGVAVWSNSLPLLTTPGKYTALPLTHPVNTKAADRVL